MNALKKASGDVESTNLAMNRILTSLMEGNAEHALAQENAAMATSGLALVAQSATLAIVDIRRLIEGLGFNVVSSILNVFGQRLTWHRLQWALP